MRPRPAATARQARGGGGYRAGVTRKMLHRGADRHRLRRVAAIGRGSPDLRQLDAHVTEHLRLPNLVGFGVLAHWKACTIGATSACPGLVLHGVIAIATDTDWDGAATALTVRDSHDLDDVHKLFDNLWNRHVQKLCRRSLLGSLLRDSRHDINGFCCSRTWSAGEILDDAIRVLGDGSAGGRGCTLIIYTEH